MALSIYIVNKLFAMFFVIFSCRNLQVAGYPIKEVVRLPTAAELGHLCISTSICLIANTMYSNKCLLFKIKKNISSSSSLVFQ